MGGADEKDRWADKGKAVEMLGGATMPWGSEMPLAFYIAGPVLPSLGLSNGN